ncbi:hypothetical protein [Methylococcus mesophilus]|uniref:hypothetical protein n=1 Tax=Methylococcus mesophilus TaxID=2993564 RepID=UPI00224A8888|nr:hypothetical protein [Methylococcus mesophilus]UZR29775.1 hypothetical protein OOT43_03820 [Methylococcus mesophilus]
MDELTHELPEDPIVRRKYESPDNFCMFLLGNADMDLTGRLTEAKNYLSKQPPDSVANVAAWALAIMSMSVHDRIAAERWATKMPYERSLALYTKEQWKAQAQAAEARAKGAKANKEKAQNNQKFIKTVNADLLKHPDTCRLKLSERAALILKSCAANRVTQLNGTPYSLSYIKKLIAESRKPTV